MEMSQFVMPGLDPGIHQSSQGAFFQRGWIAGSSPAMTGREPMASPIKQLPQNLVHRLAVGLRRIALRRGRGRRRRFGVRGLPRDRNAALAVWPRRGLSGALTGAALALTLILPQTAQALLKQIADGLAELAAE